MDIKKEFLHILNILEIFGNKNNLLLKRIQYIIRETFEKSIPIIEDKDESFDS